MAENKNKKYDIRVTMADGSEAMVAASDLFAGIRDGQWKLPETDAEGNENTFLLKDGEGVFEVPSSKVNSNVTSIIDEGTSIPGMEDIKQEEFSKRKQILDEAYGGAAGATEAFLQEGLDAATFGLSGLASRAASGLVSAVQGQGFEKGYEERARAQEAYREVNPNAALAGEITGAIGGAFIPGAPGAAAAKLGTKLGSKAAAKIAGDTIAKKAARKAVELGVGSAVEGALYSGATSLIDETTLGDDPANYSKVFEDAMVGGLTGAAGGALLGGATQAAGDLSEMLIKKGISKFTDAVDNPEVMKKFKDNYFKVFTEDTKAGKAVREIFDETKYDQKTAARYLDDLSQADKDLGLEVDKIVNKLKNVESESLRLRNEALAHPDLDARVKWFEPGSKLLETTEALDTLKGIARNPGNTIYESGLNNLVNKIDKTINIDTDSTLRQWYNGLRDAKRLLQENEFRLSSKQAKAGLSLPEQETLNVLTPFRKKVDEALKDYGTFGEAGILLKEADRLYSNVVEPAKRIRKLGEIEGYTDLVDAATGEVKGVRATKEFDPELIGEILRKRSAPKQKQKLDAAIDQLEKSFQNIDPSYQAGTLTEIERIKGIKDLVQDIQAGESQTGKSLTGLALGSLQAGGIASVIGLDAGYGFAYGAMQHLKKNPVQSIKFYNKLENSIKNINGKVKQIEIGNFNFTKPTKTVVRGLNPIVKELTGSDSDLEAVKIVNSPKFDEVLNRRLNVIAPLAPAYAQKMQNSAEVAKNYLRQELPNTYQPGRVGKAERLVISPAQTQRINQIMLASFAPGKFLDKIIDGTATNKAMAAFKDAHPELYAQSLESAMKAVQNDKLSYQEKLKIQYLFNIPVTNDLTTIGQTQQLLYGAPSKEEVIKQRENTNLNAKGLQDLNVSGANASLATKALQR